MLLDTMMQYFVRLRTHELEEIHGNSEHGYHLICIKCRQHFYRYSADFYKRNPEYWNHILPYDEDFYKKLWKAGFCDVGCALSAQRYHFGDYDPPVRSCWIQSLYNIFSF